jgi:asparagine synthase (glutamine-hydrolysing)
VILILFRYDTVYIPVMFAVIAGEDCCRPNEIATLSAALPGRISAARNVWMDENGELGVAFRAVPILPEDTFESQPFVDSELVFVARARLDERAQLLDLLQIDPKRGAVLSDADLLRHCYKRWREATPRHVYGDFAFVAWERLSGRTVAATDHLGNYRLFYTKVGKRLLMSTHLAALLACPALQTSLDVKALGMMAAGKLGHGGTMFEGINVLPGGELLIHQNQTVRIERWWNPDTSPHDLRSRDCVDEVRELFERAVISRMRARGGVVSTMSGGLDSTLVTAVAARQLTGQEKLLEVFTHVPRPGSALTGAAGDSDPNEGPWAGAVAGFHPNIRHHLVPWDGMTPLDIYPASHRISHTPVRDAANLVRAWQISGLAAHKRARVVLCGDHGNHSISYEGELCDASFARLSRIAGTAQRAWDRIRCIGTTPPVSRPAASESVDSHPMRKLRLGSQVLLPDFRAAHHEDLLETVHSADTRDLFVQGMTRPLRAARLDFIAQFGVEWRDPTSDRRLLERLLQLPLSAFRVGSRPRGLAREVGRGLLPDSVRLRRPRSIQTSDQTSWFPQRADDYRKALELVRNSPTCGQFMDLASLESLVGTLCGGHGSMKQAAIVHQALDVGLFTVDFEAGAQSTDSEPGQIREQTLGMSRAGD